MVTSTRTKKSITEPVVQMPPPNQFVTVDQFNVMADILSKLNDKIDNLQTKTQTTTEAKENKEVARASQDQAPLNPLWEDKAREIIGEAVDHCEVFLPKNGGQIFTVVIKREFSNAPKEYLERMKADRRSKEIGNEGIGGVETWCKLIAQNLKRGEKPVIR